MFEGIDGAGKTTQINIARNALLAAGWPVHCTRNLGGTPIGEALREVVLSPLQRPPLTDLYASVAIQEALVVSIDDARQAGKIILMDRGPLSLAAYQIYGTGVDEALGWRYVDSGMERLKPETIILYESDVAMATERTKQMKDKADYFESQPLSYFKRVANGYKAAGQRYPMEVIDASQSIDVIHELTMEVIRQTLARAAQ
jgi:dTMP kinase